MFNPDYPCGDDRVDPRPDRFPPDPDPAWCFEVVSLIGASVVHRARGLRAATRARDRFLTALSDGEVSEVGELYEA